MDRGYPFMTSTRRGEGVKLRWTHVDGGGGQLHVDVPTENLRVTKFLKFKSKRLKMVIRNFGG